MLPGVTVEAQSPVLIEGTKSAITDASGVYRIVDLRPGTYTISFTLPGFKTARFDAVELRTDFTATFNANLEVGALEESVTVTGASPVVDVSSNAKVEVLTREVLDQVPTGRNIQAYAQLVSGVTLNVPDVGGSRGMQQTYMSTRGLTSANNIVTVDGLMVNGLDGDGAVQQYFNQAMVQEMSYQTSGAGADVSPGGVRMAIVARDGGNQFNGSLFAGYTQGSWLANNLDDDLISRGLRAAGGIDRIYDVNVGLGGPIKRDKLWFFTSARAWSVDAPIANTFYTPENVPYPQGFAQCQSGAASCEQGIDDQSIESAAAAAHLAGELEAQDLRLLRRDQQVPRPWHERRRRSADGLADLDLAALQLGGAEVHRHAQQQPAGRGRLLVQLRGVRHHQPGRREQDGLHAGVVRGRQPSRCRPRHVAQRPGQLGRPLPRSLRDVGRAVVRHRRAHLQDRHPVQLGTVHQHA